jgi:glutamate 5-kinase
MNNNKFKRIVIKIGSSILTHESGKLNLYRIDRLLRQVVDLKNSGRELMIVSSGAIGAGMGEMGYKERPGLIPEQQALAAIGQGLLLGVYNKLLREYGEKGAQVLLTSSDLEERDRFLNAFNTLLTLLGYGVIPIINENDTVAVQEIKFGDNDTLSARVAGLIEADLLIILSDVDGLYNGDPSKVKEGLKIIHKIDEITPNIIKVAGKKGSKVGTGGMQTKLEAARIATTSGIIMVIAPGYEENIILKIVKMLEEGTEYNLGTSFMPVLNSLSKRKQWIGFNLPTNGSILIDKGAEEALLYKGKSLLPGGIKVVNGNFLHGELLSVLNSAGKEIAKGLTNYSSQEIDKIKGHHTKEIYSILGYINQEEVIHRDNMVIERGTKLEY